MRKVEVVVDPKILFLVVLSNEKNQQISLLKTALLGLKQREGEEVSPRTKRGPDKLYAQTFLDDKFALFAKQIRRTWPRRRGFDRDKLINNDEGTLHKQVLDMGKKKVVKRRILNPKFEISPSVADGFPPFVPCKCDSGLGSGSVVRIPDPLILQPIHLGPGPVNPSSASHNVITSHSHITPPVFKHELTFALKLFLAIDSPYLPTNHINHNMSKVGWGSAFICTDSSFGCGDHSHHTVLDTTSH